MPHSTPSSSAVLSPPGVLSLIDARSETSIGALNELLRGEIAASETYRHAAGTWQGGGGDVLRACQHAHEGRVILLSQRIESLGGRAVTDAGIWGMVARSAERSAFISGQRAVLQALKEGEDHGLDKLLSEMAVLDDLSRELVRTTLLPQQEELLELMRGLLAADPRPVVPVILGMAID